MHREQRKEHIMRLYKSITKTSKIIENELDTLSDKGNTAEFEFALCELLELAGILLNDE